MSNWNVNEAHNQSVIRNHDLGTPPDDSEDEFDPDSTGEYYEEEPDDDPFLDYPSDDEPFYDDPMDEES
jgi:hypothetical protein